jgi:hypothetical protein
MNEVYLSCVETNTENLDPKVALPAHAYNHLPSPNYQFKQMTNIASDKYLGGVKEASQDFCQGDPQSNQAHPLAYIFLFEVRV